MAVDQRPAAGGDGDVPGLVISGRPGGQRLFAVVGWVWLVLGLVWGAAGLGLLWWSVAGSDLSGRLFDSAPLFGVACLDVAVLLGLSAGNCLLAALYLKEAGQLRRIRLLIDHRGVSTAYPPSASPPAVVPWEWIRYVAVTHGRRGYRRLVVDDGVVPDAWWSVPTIQPGKAHWRLLAARRRRFLVNVPIDRLTVDAEEIIGAIGRHSQGRLPNRVP